MNFPESVSFKLLDDQSEQPIPNIATLLTLLAHRKNNYPVCFFISDSKGLVTITRDDCLKQIEHSKATFLMDYASTLEECLPRVEFEVLSDSDLDKAIEVRRKYRDLFQEFWDCSEGFFQRLKDCDNRHYEPKKVVFEERELKQPASLAVRIERKGVGRKPDTTP